MKFNNFMLSMKQDIQNKIKELTGINSITGYAKTDRITNFILEQFEKTTGEKISPFSRLALRFIASIFIKQLYRFTLKDRIQ